MTDAAANVELVRAVLARYSYRYGNEEQLQAGIAEVLEPHAAVVEAQAPPDRIRALAADVIRRYRAKKR